MHLVPTTVAALLLLFGPEETQEESVWPRWLLPADTVKAIRPQSLGSVCYGCRRLKMEGNSLMCCGSVSCAFAVRWCICLYMMCVFVHASAISQEDWWLPSTVRWFLHRSEIATGAIRGTGGSAGARRAWHDIGALGLFSHWRLTAHGWYLVSSCWHVTLIELASHSLAHCTAYSLGQS